MPTKSKSGRGDKSSYSDKQRRQAEHIEEGYKKKGDSSKKAERIAWATVNKETGGARKAVDHKKASAVAKNAAKTKAGHPPKRSRSTSSHSTHAR